MTNVLTHMHVRACHLSVRMCLSTCVCLALHDLRSTQMAHAHTRARTHVSVACVVFMHT